MGSRNVSCPLDEVSILQTEMDASGLGKQLNRQESLLCKRNEDQGLESSIQIKAGWLWPHTPKTLALHWEVEMGGSLGSLVSQCS